MSNSITKTFDFVKSEKKWIEYWGGNKSFSGTIDTKRKSFSIVLPPPNITGILHLGHTLNCTIQDILIRRAKMKGYNTCWVPGCDHASIATEAKVVEYLKNVKGIHKKDLSREQFLHYVYEWKEKYGGVIYDQIKKLGCAVDWDRATFTMDKHYYNSVIQIFIDLYKKGYLYKSEKIINWDPKAKTVLSDEEVEHQKESGVLYYLKYYILNDEGEKSKEYISIATQRPETIMGDTAICVHPQDDRYKNLIGKKVAVPLINKQVPIISDEYIDMEFGSGALKVTPAHDVNDYNLGKKHELEIIGILNDDGTLNERAKIFVGEDRFVVRKKIVNTLNQEEYLIKKEQYQTSIGYSQRTHVVIEPKISTQWFMKMDEVSKDALKDILDKEIEIFPKNRFINDFRNWLENPKDWCISRQLWWGHRIPAYYSPNNEMVIAKSKEEALTIFHKKQPTLKIDEIIQDEDCLDTWFSSWLWPMEVFKGFTEPDNRDFKYFFPTSVLVTAPEILYFWVARMIMASKLKANQIPFKKVYFTGLIRDEKGKKMSKSLGNSPDLLKLIETYGTDAVRFSVMISSSAGNDLLYSEKTLEQGKIFINKIWNALKLLKTWEYNSETTITDGLNNDFANKWMKAKLSQTSNLIDDFYSNFQLNEVLKQIYSLIWNDYCSQYLEWIKPAYSTPQNLETLSIAKSFFSKILLLLHPFMPFVTNEIYALLHNSKQEKCLSGEHLFPHETFDQKALEYGSKLIKIISALRDYRVKNSIYNKEKIHIQIVPKDRQLYKEVAGLIKKMGNVEYIEFLDSPKYELMGFTIDTDMLYCIDDGKKNTTEIKEKRQQEITQQMNHLEKFLQSIEKKLNNEHFRRKAKKEIIEKEEQKRKDIREKIAILKKDIS